MLPQRECQGSGGDERNLGSRRDQHGATHAWTEIYIPGAGWHGFDPTNNKIVGGEHVSVAVAREQEKASPLCGSWHGPADAFCKMEASVQVVPL